MSEYESWWEHASPAEFVVKLVLHPRVVKRQIMVAAEVGQSPLTSDLETFHTLPPIEAGRLLKKWEIVVKAKEKAAKQK